MPFVGSTRSPRFRGPGDESTGRAGRSARGDGGSAIRILHHDPSRLFVEVLAAMLEEAGHETVWLPDAADLGAVAGAAGPFDVCVTEVVASADATTWIDDLRSASPGARVVVLTRRLRQTRLAALCASADAVVPKSAPVDLTLQAVDGRRSGLVHHPAPARAPESPTVLVDPSLLTPREHEVLAELANGLSTGCIADQLGVAHTTARTYIQSILTKLGVHSKVQAVALAFALDLVGPPDLAASSSGGSTGSPGTARVA